MASDSQFENLPDTSEPGLDARLQHAARSFQYPATPDLAARERLRMQSYGSGRLDKTNQQPAGIHQNRPARRANRKLTMGIGWALAVVLLIAGLILVTPAPVRARVVEWLRLGAVRLHLIQDATPLPEMPPQSLTGLAGETTLPQAAAQAPFPLKLPTYPHDLQEPQRVFFQQINGASVVIMAWLKPGDPQEVRLVLYQIGEGDVFQKQLMDNIQQTTINGEWALWVTGPYLLTTTRGGVEQRRIVAGHTLIWSADRLTFRLETDLPLEEARKIAESLKEWQAR